MAQPRRTVRPPDGRLALHLSPGVRLACAILNVLPLPGVGAVVAGWRNPHTGLRRDGLLQALLVLFGSWPLILPGVIGLSWSIWTATRIGQARLLRLPPKGGADPEATPQKG